jgi:hypothetical protein
MTASSDDRPRSPKVPEDPRRPYEKPRLVDYGLVSKLTLTGGITTKDVGNMERRCL